MTIEISAPARSLLSDILLELTDKRFEYLEENGGLPSCIFCRAVAVPGPDKVPHTDDCLATKALELAREWSR